MSKYTLLGTANNYKASSGIC